MAIAATPALADEIYAVTPSGAPEQLFDGTAKDTVGKLANRCMDARWQIVTTTENQLVCEAPMSFGQSLMGTLLMGNSYSTPPRQFFRFNVVEINGQSRVQVSGWMELQMAFGQTRRTDFAGAPFYNGAMTFLSGAGGKYPHGTVFPNHAWLGAQFDTVPVGKEAHLRITSFDEGSPAQASGMAVGDEITRIAGKKFKDLGSLLDAMAAAAKTDSYKVAYERGGKVQEAVVRRAFRPRID